MIYTHVLNRGPAGVTSPARPGTRTVTTNGLPQLPLNIPGLVISLSRMSGVRAKYASDQVGLTSSVALSCERRSVARATQVWGFTS
jgi:hypothetical protein